MTDSDRTVHAHCDCLEVVRYDRSGKWWIEYRDTRPRERIDVAQAAIEALDCEGCDGLIFAGRRGGSTFDREVTKAREVRKGRHACNL